MTCLVQAITVPFSDPDPTGLIHDYDSIRCTPGRPGTGSGIIEILETETEATYSNSKQGRQRLLSVANG